MGSSLFSFKKWNLNAIQIDDNNDDLPSYTSPPSHPPQKREKSPFCGGWEGGADSPPPHPPQKREKSLFCGGWEGEIAFAMAFGDGTKCTVSLTLKIPCFFTTSLRRFHNNKIAEKCGDLPNLPQHPPLPSPFAMALGDGTKCKTCFGGPRMILHAH